MHHPVSEGGPWTAVREDVHNEIMRYVRKWHEQIGDMPSKQVVPEVLQIHREM